MSPNLPTVEQVLEDGVESHAHRGQGMQVMVGHPNAHGGVFLAEKLASRDGIAVFVPNPLAKGELHRAKQQRSHGKPENDAPVALAVQEDEVDGLPDGEKQRHRP